MARMLTKATRDLLAELHKKAAAGRNRLLPGAHLFESKRNPQWDPVQAPRADHLPTPENACIWADRSRLVTELRHQKLPRPTPEIGAMLEALAASGLFTQGYVIIDRTAYQTYSVLLETRLRQPRKNNHPQAPGMTELTVATTGPLPDPQELLPALQRCNKIFDLQWSCEHDQGRQTYRAGDRQRLTLLSVYALSIAADRESSRTGQALSHLIEDPVEVPALFGSGILVRVPRPELYAVGRMLCGLAHLADEATVRADILQASELLKGSAKARRWPELKAAFIAALRHGLGRRLELKTAALQLHPGAVPIALWCLKQATADEAKLTNRPASEPIS